MADLRKVRNRKQEMISCWACVVFVALIYGIKMLLLSHGGIDVLDHVLWTLEAFWVIISIVYTVLFFIHRREED